jgi:hypothetical protein
MEGAATEAADVEEATEEAERAGAMEEEAMEAADLEEAREVATEAEAMEGAATEAADEEEEREGEVEAKEAEAQEEEAERSNDTCHPAPPRRCLSLHLHRRRSQSPKETQGGSCRYVRQPHRLQRSAMRHYVCPLRLRSRPWPESDHRLQLVKNERPRSRRRHRRLRCTRCQRNWTGSSSLSRRPGRR